MERPVRVARFERPLDLCELVEELLEPELIDLVDDDEQELVVLRPVIGAHRERFLRRQDLLQPEV